MINHKSEFLRRTLNPDNSLWPKLAWMREAPSALAVYISVLNLIFRLTFECQQQSIQSSINSYRIGCSENRMQLWLIRLPTQCGKDARMALSIQAALYRLCFYFAFLQFTVTPKNLTMKQSDQVALTRNRDEAISFVCLSLCVCGNRWLDLYVCACLSVCVCLSVCP